MLIMSMDAEYSFGKIQHHIHGKTCKKLKKKKKNGTSQSNKGHIKSLQQMRYW